MRIAVLSDTRLPTSKAFPGHGLGKVALNLAEGLKARGHNVMLFAAAGSEWSGTVVTAQNEQEFARLLMQAEAPDVVLDITHEHSLQRVLSQLKIVNVAIDSENTPGRNAVFPSDAHRKKMGYRKEAARIIGHGVDTDEYKPADLPIGGHFIYLSMFHAPKGPVMAWNAARLTGVPLVMAGPTPPAPPPGVIYAGPMAGINKIEFFSTAKALLYPAGTESGGVVPLEAQACGCPVIVSSFGGTAEGIAEAVTGFAVRDTLEMAEAIRRIDSIDRKAVRAWAVEHRGLKPMIDGYEQALSDVANGVNW